VFPAQEDFSTPTSPGAWDGRPVLSLRDDRGRPSRRARLLLYLVVACVIGPVIAAVFLGGGFQILGYPF
jgi:hypothetical protein